MINFDGIPIQHSGSPPSGFIWIEKKLSDSLGLNQSDKVSIGNKNLIVEGIIEDYPDRNSSFVGFYPIAIVNINDVDEMGVIQTGSRVVYRKLFSGTQDNLDRYEKSLGSIPASIRVQNALEAGDNLGEDIANSSTFFNLASLFTIIISVIAAMMAVKRYASRNLLHTSLMKVFGASKSFILGHQIMQLVLIVITASILGLIFGYALQHLLLSTLQGIINANLPPPSFDDISIIPTFVLTPLIYLGGVFYSINILPDIWRNISMANPMLYVVNTFREGMLGVSDVSIPFALAMIVFFIVMLTSACLFLLHRGVGTRQ